MTTPLVTMQGGPAPCADGSRRGMRPMIPAHLEPLFDLFDTTTDEGVGARVGARNRRMTRAACPGRNEP